MKYNPQQLQTLLEQAYTLVDMLVEPYDGTLGKRLAIIRHAQRRVERRERMAYNNGDYRHAADLARNEDFSGFTI